MFYKRLCQLLSEKRGEDIGIVTSWVRTTISFALLRSVLVAIRGSRHPFYKRVMSEVEMKLDMEETKIRDV